MEEDRNALIFCIEINQRSVLLVKLYLRPLTTTLTKALAMISDIGGFIFYQSELLGLAAVDLLDHTTMIQ